MRKILRQSHKNSKRKIKRKSFFSGEGVKASIVLNNESIDAKVLDLTPQGVGLAVSLTNREHCKLNVPTDIQISLPKSNELFLKGLIVNVSEIEILDEKMCRLGIMFCDSKASEDLLEPEEKLGEKFTFSASFRPTAICDNEFFFKQIIHFSVLAIGAKSATLLTSDNYRYLIQGLVLRLNFILPSGADERVEATISEVKPDPSKRQTLVEVTFNSTSTRFLANVAEAIMLALPQTGLTELRNAGLINVSLERLMYFSYIENQEDMNEVLKLRLLAWQGNNRCLDEKDHTKMLDPYDEHSRHIVGKIGNKIVVCARVVFNNGDLDRSEMVISGARIPEFILKKGFVEISRLCTHPDFRGGNVMINTMRHLARVTIQAGFQYQIFGCEESLIRPYQRWGIKSLNQVIYEEFAGGLKLHLFYMNIKEILKGPDANPLYWKSIWGPISVYLYETEAIKYSILDRVYQLYYKILDKISSWRRPRP